MDNERIYIIEARDEAGQLKFDCPDPSTVFGNEAITGITENKIADIVYRKHPEAILHGTNIPDWAKCFNPNWKIRRKTW